MGHLAKIPVFLSLGFSYRENLGLLAPLLVAAVGGTYLGTRLLRNLRPRHFDVAFRGILLLLAIRLLVPR